jgi:serine/threonine-protein kinase
VTTSQEDPVKKRARARLGAVLREKWRLDALLGVGGMAAVYAATHRNGKRGAVKMLHIEVSNDADARKRFLREGYVANAVAHPGAVSVLDDDVAEDGAVFLVMELLEGQNIDARAESHPGGKLPPEEVLAIADQLLDILAAAHAKGIVHRDLKPENLFLTQTGQVKVLDFGLARLQELSRGPNGQRLTTTGSAMGTPAFMPPEQALGNWDQVDARTDLWAVGASMFTLLTSRFVHEAENVNKLLLAAMTKPARSVRSVDPSLPPAVASIVDRALAFEQRDRWPDAVTMRAAVRQARAGVRSEFVTLAELADPGASAAVHVVGGDPQTPATGVPAGGAPRVPSRTEPMRATPPQATSLGPTSSSPEVRAGLGKKGFVAGAAFVGIAGAAVLFVALRTSHTDATAQATTVTSTEAADPPARPGAAAPPPATATAEPVVRPADSAAPTASASAAPVAPPTASAQAPRLKPTAASRPNAAPAIDPLKKW